MSKNLRAVICEKPSVARDIARHLGATQKNEGYLEGNGFVVTWAFGHLLELKDLHEYKPEWKSWKIDNLPLIPDSFLLKPKAEKGIKEQLKIIKNLFDKSSEIICATDAGREGELIFRYIQTFLKVKSKPFKRLWISSLTDEAIAKGFLNLKDGSEFDALYRAARCRSEADWIVGLNATRFYTVLYGQGRQLWSLGRVQTPVLSMITARDQEISNFQESDYWEIHSNFKDVNFKHKTGRFDDKAEAQTILDKISEQSMHIKEIKTKEETVLPPFLYDLTELQKDMNRRFLMSADQTLKAAQSLYEKKHLSYPRTDSKFLTEDVARDLPALFEKLKEIRPHEISKIDLEKNPINSRLVNDLKVSDHHAIIPTTLIPRTRLTDDELKIYHSVLIRLIASVYPAAKKHNIQIEAFVGKEEFKASGSVYVNLGWEALYKNKKNEDKADTKNNIQALMDISKESEGPHEAFLKSLKTKPPQAHTEASILQMMESAGRHVSDEKVKTALKERGIGTPATRASIIETLLNRKYIQRKTKNIVSTPEGQKLIGLIEDERLKSAELTGEWELLLKKIENNDYDDKKFISEVKQYIKDIVGLKNGETGIGPCPLCQSLVIEGKKGFGCSKWKTGCKFVLWKEYKGSQISTVMAAQLLRLKRTMSPIMLIEDQEQKFYDLELDADGNVQATLRTNHKVDIDKSLSKKSIGLCPKCHSPVIDTPKAFSCSRWRHGCNFNIWKTIANKKITTPTAKALLEEKQTEVLDGFKSKKGELFSAKLVLDNHEVKFDFK